MSQLSEDDLIATLFAPIAGPGGLQLRDDAAVVQPTPGCDLVVTADALVAGVHFFPDDPPGSIARKALGVNLSDLAAKGARPVGFVLTIALTPDWTADWLAAFAAGLGTAADEGLCPLLGGDTVRTPGPLTLSITAFGEVPAGRMLTRIAAAPGDRLFVSGTIGDAALGLRVRLAERSSPGTATARTPGADMLVDRYLHPQPRLHLVPALLAHARAAMDVSDGLIGDLRKLCLASGVSAEVDLAMVPLAGAARAMIGDSRDDFAIAVTGGDDYEILAAVALAEAEGFARAAEAAGVAVTAIGTVTEGLAAPVFRHRDGTTAIFDKGSFSHF